MWASDPDPEETPVAFEPIEEAAAVSTEELVPAGLKAADDALIASPEGSPLGRIFPLT